MSVELIIVLATVALAVVLFLSEKIRPAMVAVLVMAILLGAGIVTPAQGFAGFSNQATIAIAAMFVLSKGLENTGAVDLVGNVLGAQLSKHYWAAWLGLMAGAGIMSAFINNTAVVAILIPILLKSSREADVSATRLLLPVSFASMFGGVCTLIGTSTNLLVSSIAERQGQPALSMFDFTLLGAVFFGIGLVYLFGVVRLLPERREPGELTQSYGLRNYLTDVVLTEDSPSVGLELVDTNLVHEYDLDVLTVFSSSPGEEEVEGEDEELEGLAVPARGRALAAGDRLRIRSDIEVLRSLQQEEGLTISWLELGDADIESQRGALMEVTVAPSSSLDGSTLQEVRFHDRFNAIPLGVRQRGELLREDLREIRLRGGDVLLLKVPTGNVEQIRESDEFIVVSEQAESPDVDPVRIPVALAIIAGVVLLAALDVMPIAVSAVLGCVALVLSGILTLEDAFEAIEWNIILLLAGVLTLGVGLEVTGADELLSRGLVAVSDWGGPTALLSALYLITTLLTSTMSNQATAALLVPIAIVSADQLGIDARPFIMTVAYAASASFLTPVGYQTNTMVYGAGHYKFKDFVYFGGPLTFIFWGVATWLIPIIWPFHP